MANQTDELLVEREREREICFCELYPEIVHALINFASDEGWTWICSARPLGECK